MPVVTLTTGDLERMLDLAAERAAERVLRRFADATATLDPRELVTVERLAAEIGMSRAWCYKHADRLGAVPLGEVGKGKRPRKRFDLAVAKHAMSSVGSFASQRETGSSKPNPPAARPRRRRTPVPAPKQAAGSILGCRPRETSA